MQPEVDILYIVSFAFFYTQKRLTLGANQKDHFCEDALVSVSL